MIAVDANILIYSHRRDSPFHDRARAAMLRLAEDSQPWGIPWPCLHEFYCVATHPRIYRTASTPDEAVTQVELWLGSPAVTLLGESEAHWQTLRSLVAAGKIKGPAVYDARIAAICIEHGVKEFWTADRDFSRYPDLKPVNPLVVAEDRL